MRETKPRLATLRSRANPGCWVPEKREGDMPPDATPVNIFRAHSMIRETRHAKMKNPPRSTARVLAGLFRKTNEAASAGIPPETAEA